MGNKISVWLVIAATVLGGIYTFNERSYHSLADGIKVAENSQKTAEALEKVTEKLDSLNKRTDDLEKQKLLDEIKRLKEKTKERQITPRGR